MSSAGNYRAYRIEFNDALHVKDNFPIVPYLGLYLRDLTFSRDGNPTFFDSQKLNYDKIRMIGSLLLEISSLQQQKPVTFESLSKEDYDIIMVLKTLPGTLEDETLYEYASALKKSQTK
jgi:hypothetical protein